MSYIDLDVTLRRNRTFTLWLTKVSAEWAYTRGDIQTATEWNIGREVRNLAEVYSPIVTGSLASSHAVYTGHGTNPTFVAISELATNPYSEERPIEYGPKVHEMGGISRSGHRRDFYDALLDDHRERLQNELAHKYMVSLGIPA